MKTLVVFYSYDGNSALVVEELQKALGEGCDTLELRIEDGTRRSGLAKYLWGGRMVFSRTNPTLKPYDTAIDGYDLVILGGPVWAGAPAPALQSFIAKTKPEGKKIGLFLCHGGGPGKSFDKLKALLPGNVIAGTIDFVNPAKQDRTAVAQKVGEWLAGMGDEQQGMNSGGKAGG
jgi:flavodoxin